jgi:hypothetical protein
MLPAFVQRRWKIIFAKRKRWKSSNSILRNIPTKSSTLRSGRRVVTPQIALPNVSDEQHPNLPTYEKALEDLKK